MKIGGVNHIGINTLDLEKSKAFYQDIMGFTLEGEADLGGDYAAYLRVDEHTTLELFRTDGTLPVMKPAQGYTGLRHVAFAVDNVDAWCAHLKAHDVFLELEPLDLEMIKKRVLLLAAPDNVIIELAMDI